ncbi:MAG: glycosyltransferase [Proteobacteria bacterium]|nr:glycosyltransferase [Pseudomonadota bacterium]MDA1181863.1 glycosyltransferase [Pseudomonadota bacterium]
MSSFNLVQIVPSLDSGGVERGTVDVANFLAEKKIQNFIITSGGKMIKELDERFIHVHQLPVASKNFFSYPLIARKINQFIKANNINIVHVRSRGPAWMVNLIAKNNIKTIATFHNVYGGYSYLKKMYNKGLSKMDHLVAISDYVKETIVKKYDLLPNNISVINRGVDTEYFNQPLDVGIRDNILKTHQIDTTKKIILFPARITSWKGQLEFIDVIKKMDTQNILVLFAGDTKNKSYTKLVRDKIKQNNLKRVCKILGSVNQDEMRSLYQIADLSLSFPLRTEGFGRTVSESLYSKTPVLAFDYGGVKNQLANLSDMFKVKPQDFQVLPAKIEKLLSLSDVEKKEALEGVQSVIESNFSKINMVKQYLKLYESFKS